MNVFPNIIAKLMSHLPFIRIMYVRILRTDPLFCMYVRQNAKIFIENLKNNAQKSNKYNVGDCFLSLFLLRSQHMGGS